MLNAAEPAPEQHHTVSVAPPYSPRHLGKAPAGEAETPGHGLECIVEILAHIVGLVASDAGGGHGGGSMDEFGLELMNAALSAGGTGARPRARHARDALCPPERTPERSGISATLASLGCPQFPTRSHALVQLFETRQRSLCVQ